MPFWLPNDVLQPSFPSSSSLRGIVADTQSNPVENRSFKLTIGGHFCCSLNQFTPRGWIRGGARCPENCVFQIPIQKSPSLLFTRKLSSRALVSGSTASMTGSIRSVAASAHASRDTKETRTPSASQLPLAVLPGGQLRNSMVDQALVWASLNGLVVGDAAVKVCPVGYIGLAYVEGPLHLAVHGHKFAYFGSTVLFMFIILLLSMNTFST